MALPDLQTQARMHPRYDPPRTDLGKQQTAGKETSMTAEPCLKAFVVLLQRLSAPGGAPAQSASIPAWAPSSGSVVNFAAAGMCLHAVKLTICIAAHPRAPLIDLQPACACLLWDSSTCLAACTHAQRSHPTPQTLTTGPLSPAHPGPGAGELCPRAPSSHQAAWRARSLPRSLRRAAGPCWPTCRRQLARSGWLSTWHPRRPRPCWRWTRTSLLTPCCHTSGQRRSLPSRHPRVRSWEPASLYLHATVLLPMC